ncbi:MAG: 23S rRNA (cytidine(2498)-2'-O)-methyltransferase RlmM [Myxococcaceae bacterium]|nr:23S rRNA (cytidine(2498)-2'-O)-methyltransferase RlmM [Myxococcaceae bacterium]
MPPLPTAPARDCFLWTCRAGFEGHLYEELAWAKAHPTLVGPALVASDAHPGLRPAFGRMGFGVLWSGTAFVAEAFARSLGQVGLPGPVFVQGWSVDDPVSLRRSQEAEAMAEAVARALPAAMRADSAECAREQNGTLAQVVAAGDALWIAGVVGAREAVSLSPGGRQRMRRGPASPSRASMKLEEALRGLWLSPGRGDVCVDLGAAPGGWTGVLVARGASVIAVDPARLRPELLRHPKVRHIRESAFAFEPEAPVDWLFCDMAWRPLEVAQLLAKWARRRWAVHLVANIKLPMKDKNPIILRVRRTLEDGGWQQLSVRQLYHDRDEVTVTARRAR